jgi:SHS family lactate transporter-like MFS transporter
MKDEREAKIRSKHEDGDHVRATGFRSFIKDSAKVLRANWVLFIYMVLIMTGMNSCTHGSQDFYPTFLKDQLGMNATNTTIITVVGQIGTFLGGALMGYLSTFFGRRLTMMVTCIFGGALIPAYVLPKNMSLVGTVFVEQFWVGGVWGPVPIHLMELAPPQLRTLMVGLTYQLGNLASSASSTIQSTIGERYPLPPLADGTKRYDYGHVIGIFMGAVWTYLFLVLLLGPEMSQEERQAEAEAAVHMERLRSEGVSLVQIGERRAEQSQESVDTDLSEKRSPDEELAGMYVVAP